MKKIKLWIWALRVRKCAMQADGDYGQFLGNVGYLIAVKALPRDVLNQLAIDQAMSTKGDEK